MPDAARSVQRTYLTLTLLSTLAASFIWGINTLFLLDAGLSNTQAFTANAFFTLGMVVFEVPTGVIADTWGRRASFLLGTATLLVSTLLYLLMWQVTAPFWGWALASAFIGLGFTFFSGAVEAWLVDALAASGYTGDLEPVFGRGQVVAGAAMLGGSVAGGFLAQATDLGVPYLVRSAILGVTFVVALAAMRDLGFTRRRVAHPIAEMRSVLAASIDGGWRRRPVRWVMLAGPFTTGVSIYAFYAMQPHLLRLHGDDTAFGIAGLAAAILAGAQIAGGLLVPAIRKGFSRRTHALLTAVFVGTLSLAVIGITRSFWIAIGMLVVWAVTFAAATPIQQAYLNGLIPSEQRATVLSFTALFGSTGGVVAQPALGRAADAWGYAPSYLMAAGIQAFALPFLAMARRERAASDPINR